MPHLSPGAMPRLSRTVPPAVLPILVLALVLSLTACRDTPPPDVQGQRRTTSEAVTVSAQPVVTRTKIHRVFGRLPEARRKAVRRDVEKVVDGWWEAAYLGGTYPRDSFPSAFPGFTRGAEQRARADKALLTNETHGTRIESVVARRRAVSLDVLAVGGHARSVTATFVLRFRTTGEKQGTTTVRGRLLLTRRGGPWRVFGYDVSKGSSA